MSDILDSRIRTRLLVAAELVSALVYGGLTGFQVEGKLIDVAASIITTVIFLIWLSYDRKLHEIEMSKIQKILFFLIFTAPFMILWYGIRSRKQQALRFFGKLLGISVIWLLVFAVPYVFIGLFITNIF